MISKLSKTELVKLRNFRTWIWF